MMRHMTHAHMHEGLHTWTVPVRTAFSRACTGILLPLSVRNAQGLKHAMSCGCESIWQRLELLTFKYRLFQVKYCHDSLSLFYLATLAACEGKRLLL
jgi:hypothetical protein